MSGEFRELNGRPYYFHNAIEEAAQAEPGEHRISQTLQVLYKALAPVEAGAAWFEASDSGPDAPVLALIQQWSAIDAAHKQLDSLRKEYEAVIDSAIRDTHKMKSIGTFMGHDVMIRESADNFVRDEILRKLRA